MIWIEAVCVASLQIRHNPVKNKVLRKAFLAEQFNESVQQWCFHPSRREFIEGAKTGERGLLRATLSQIRTTEFRSPRSDTFGDRKSQACPLHPKQRR
jgi:hypothetical protein